MPQRVNGCGTWYHGKKNVQTYQGVCQSCHRLGTLTSYDTRLFIDIFLIPVIPIARKRIIDQCSYCTRHRVLPLAVWHEAQRRAQEAIEAYQQSPRDAEKAKAALGVCVTYRDYTAFATLAPMLEENFRTDSEVLSLLSQVYDMFGQIGDSQRVLTAAVEAEDSDANREALADCLMRQGLPEEAEPYLQHVIDQGIPDRLDHIYALAQGYQSKGVHEKALSLFDRCEEINPLMSNDPVFVELRNASARQRASRISVSPAKIAQKVKRRASWQRFKKVSALVIVLGPIAYVALAWIQGKSRTVYIVNGIERTYSARINGREFKLEPHSVTKAKFPEGQLLVEIVNPPFPVPSETVSMRTSFLTRPFSNQTFVLNPDGAAVLRKTRVYYTSRKDTPPDNTFLAGQTLHQFGGLDLAFEKFPDSVSVDSVSHQATRDGVFLASQGGQVKDSTILLAVADDVGKGRVARMMERRLLLDPERGEYTHLLSSVASPQACAAFLKQGLAYRPVLVEWHRSYQFVMRGDAQEAEVQREYAGMLAREPDNSDLMYLSGRASNDVDEAVPLFRKAMAAPRPCAFAYYALAYNLSANGQFAEAVPLVLKAMDLRNEESTIRGTAERVLLAAGEHQKLLDLLKKDEAAPLPNGAHALTEEIYVHTITEQPDQAEAKLKELRRRLEPFEPALSSPLLKRIEANREYVAGHPEKAAEILLTSTQAADRFVAQLSAGHLDEADRELPPDFDEGTPTAQGHLLLYLAAELHHNAALADKHLKNATDALSKGDFEDRVYGSLLQGGKDPSGGKYLRLPQHMDEKLVILTALGHRDPARRSECFALARTLNFDRRFPHLLVKRVIDSQPAP